MFDAGKIRMIGLPYGEKNYDDIMLSRFHTIGLPACHGQTDGWTDRQTDSIALLYQYRASVCWRAIKKRFLKKFLYKNTVFKVFFIL